MRRDYSGRAKKLRAFAAQLIDIADQLEGMGQAKEKAPPAIDGGAASWIGEAGDLWRDSAGEMPYYRFGRALAPLVALHGWPLVRDTLKSYLSSRPHMRGNGTIWGDLPSDGPHNQVEDRRFMNPEDFAKTFQTWRARVTK